MRHRVKKIKFRLGRDANKMLVRKLAVNFISNAKIETTIKKAKVLKSIVEKLVEKAKVENEANKNYLLKMLDNKKLVSMMFEEVGQTLKDRVGGYIRIVRSGVRHSDGSAMARLEWVYPLVKENSPSPSFRWSKATEKSSPTKSDVKTIKR